MAELLQGTFVCVRRKKAHFTGLFLPTYYIFGGTSKALWKPILEATFNKSLQKIIFFSNTRFGKADKEACHMSEPYACKAVERYREIF